MYQTSLLQKKLEEAFDRCPPDDNLRSVLANAAAVRAYKIQTGQEEVEDGDAQTAAEAEAAANSMRDIDDECPICYEDIDVKKSREELTFCPTCRRPTHKDCFSRWKTTKTQSHETVTCVYCRTPWVEPPATNGTPGKVKGVVVGAEDGYVNLASLQGMSTERDKSTYADWFRKHRR